MPEAAMYERFTDRARKIMQHANQEAQRLNHEYIGTEHILLGLVKEGSGVAVDMLKNLNIDLRKIQLEIEKIVQSGPDMVTMGKLHQTPRAKKAIEYAIEEARNLNDDTVGTRHLLLGLLREQEGVAAQVLMNLGLQIEEVRAELLVIMGKKTRSPRAAAPKAVAKALAEDLSGLPLEIQNSVREMDAAIEKLNQQKEGAVAVHDFEKAALLRDRAVDLKKKRQRLIHGG
jgi:ATP-dependent Clp protease ATP-binding subunit ClpA